MLLVETIKSWLHEPIGSSENYWNGPKLKINISGHKYTLFSILRHLFIINI